MDRRLLVGTDAGVILIEGDTVSGELWGGKVALDTDGGSIRCLGRDPTTGHLLAGVAMTGAGLHSSPAVGAPWTPVSGWPTDRAAWALAPVGGGRLVVASDGPTDLMRGSLLDGGWKPSAAFRAIPERATWDFMDRPDGAHILGFSRDPLAARRWMAAVETGGVVASRDDGGSWAAVSPRWDVHAVLHAPGGVRLAATSEGVFWSGQDAEEWSLGGGSEGYATALALDADDVLFAVVRARAGSALVTSGNGGRSWVDVEQGAELPDPDFGVHALLPDPVVPGLLYYGAGDGVWVVDESGAWPLRLGLPPVRRLLLLF